jgi:hypothetical protein
MGFAGLPGYRNEAFGGTDHCSGAIISFRDRYAATSATPRCLTCG